MEEETSWHSYPSVFALGHAAARDLLLDEVVVQEKVDGSQFSFGRFPTFDPHGEVDGWELRCRSKGATLNILAPEKMFVEAVDYVKQLGVRLPLGLTFRAEYLKKPKHNALAYDRTPRNHLVVFDVNYGHEKYCPRFVLERLCNSLDLEPIPEIFRGRIEDPQFFRDALARESFLGGQKIEGVVVKNYLRFGPDKKVLMGKLVSEAFKEVQAAKWKAANPGKLDIVEAVIHSLRTPARWHKAIQHLAERGELQGSLRDIGALVKETQDDIRRECTELVQEELTRWAMPHVLRGVVRGLPEFYKEELLKKQFEQEAGA